MPKGQQGFQKGHKGFRKKESYQKKEYIEKLRKSHLGKKQSEETKEKRRQTMLGRDAYWMKGKKLSIETRKKMSKAKKGQIPWNKGISCTEEHKENIKKAQLKRWDEIGRKPYKRYKHYTNKSDYKKWRTSVFERDNYTCQECGEVGGYLQAHHIKSWAEYPKIRYNINNGITLCKICHQRIHKINKLTK